jgi:hypothetical protein
MPTHWLITHDRANLCTEHDSVPISLRGRAEAILVTEVDLRVL